ncbi:hypothetical protein R3W88_022801 [Solanum pinnatisectum]|uniref:Uncharacterized protein n=1 Tax=Solanum pinnatisectum TaxID=50273 RepID=A0AAV9LWH1_9SOLN|nr:hypothetical protein R3W88_022801 [Solanum pinnatisectum]
MRNTKNPIHLLKMKGTRHVIKKRKIDMQDPVFGTFAESTASPGSRFYSKPSHKPWREILGLKYCFFDPFHYSAGSPNSQGLNRKNRDETEKDKRA